MDPDDHRVEFDFEVEFLNGAGLQSQGFRLDIVEDDLSDDELATTLVRDLRLLMVGDIRIRDKQILVERHKRERLQGSPTPGPTDARASTSATRWRTEWSLPGAAGPGRQ